MSIPFRPASQLAPRSLAWLWPGRLALGKLSLFEGDPGLSKSLIALDLCARLSTGRAMPDGSPGIGPAASLVLNGEDDAQDTIIPRLQALGADLDRVFIHHQGEDDPGGLLRLPSQTGILAESLAQTQARLVVIDPITAFLDPSVGNVNDASVRRALLPLILLGQRHQCSVLLQRHLNKTGRTHAMYRGGGSIGFVAACRSAWLFAVDPDKPETRVMAEVKNNLAPPQASRAYRVDGAEGGLPTLTWLGADSRKAEQLLAGYKRPAPSMARDRAREFLLSFLEEGPRTSREIWGQARAEGHSEKTLRRAKGELDIQSVRMGPFENPVNYWKLPGQKLPDAMSSGLEPWLAPLREKYPPATPLDDM